MCYGSFPPRAAENNGECFARVTLTLTWSSNRLKPDARRSRGLSKRAGGARGAEMCGHLVGAHFIIAGDPAGAEVCRMQSGAGRRPGRSHAVVHCLTDNTRASC